MQMSSLRIFEKIDYIFLEFFKFKFSSSADDRRRHEQLGRDRAGRQRPEFHVSRTRFTDTDRQVAQGGRSQDFVQQILLR